MDHPLFGGLNVPRPQLVDIDEDGDMDLFVQERNGQIMFFENTGSPETAQLTWRTDHYGELDVGEWYRFFDIDQDGDLDILGETRNSYVRLFRNNGSAAEPVWAPALDSLRDAGGTPLFADRQNIPGLTDIDCDGRTDLFIGRINGTVHRYESVGMDASGLPRFQLVTDRFEDIEIVSQFVTLHGANTMAFHDVDKDGDEDLFWGDFWEPGILLIPNTGTCASPDLRNEPIPFPFAKPVQTSGYNAPMFADLDADGDADFLFGVLGGAFNPNVTAAANFHYLERTDAGYELRSETFLSGVDIGSESYPSFGDLDGDGDLDLLLSNKISANDNSTGEIYYFENVSEPGILRWRARGLMEISGHYNFAPELADLDADGDLDMLVGTYNRGMLLMRNHGTAQAAHFVEDESGTVMLTRGSNSTPALVDIDADGDLDLFAGESSGDLNFFRNAGTVNEPRFELVSDKFGGIDVGRRSVPRFSDLDGDGDFDMVLGREAGGALLYLNTGTPGEPDFEESGLLPVPMPINATPVFVDVDGDGDLDLFSGSVEGGLLLFRRGQ